MKSSLVILLTSLSLVCWAKGRQENLMSLGQGISTPSSTQFINLGSGFTSENPVGAIYQDGPRLTGQYLNNNESNSNAFGVELGYGNKDFGFGVGYLNRNCTGCDGTTSAAVGGAIKGLGFGLKVTEDQYTLGLIFNPNGTHRFGLVAEINTTGGDGNKITSGGVGYSYNQSQFSFALDASTIDYENTTIDDLVIVTPGLAIETQKLQISLNDRIVINNTQKTTDDDIWFGLGFMANTWHLAAYADFVSDISVNFSYFF